MKAYHFTPRHLVPSIQKMGLSEGVLVTSFIPVLFTRGYQWLTLSPAWEQGWEVPTGRLPYRRNEARLTVEIPDADERLIPWSRLRFLIPATEATLSACGDADQWLVFRGVIPPTWICAIDRNPGPVTPRRSGDVPA